MKIGCVVVAAGKGTRAGLGYNKVFCDIHGRCVLERTLERLSAGGRIDEITLVLAEEDIEAYKALPQNPLVKRIAMGGATRRESVYSGLKVTPCDIVLVHDAARLYVTDEIIENVIADAVQYGSGVISTPVTDTTKRVDAEGFALETLKRQELRAVQTPQAFRYAELLRAHRECPAEDTFTDDASMYEHIYGRVRLTEANSAALNTKITTMDDINRARRELTHPRIGTGYDVHRLVEDRKLILCGVEIPYEKGLLGHSDADVALHALMDALLGAAALGDIGKLFPDSDDRYKGISSLILLRETAKALKAKGLSVGNCDVTIVCQKPKLAPYIPKMRENIAQILEIDLEYVSVKATTTEHLGFEGEGLGISAQAVALLY